MDQGVVILQERAGSDQHAILRHITRKQCGGPSRGSHWERIRASSQLSKRGREAYSGSGLTLEGSGARAIVPDFDRCISSRRDEDAAIGSSDGVDGTKMGDSSVVTAQGHDITQRRFVKGVYLA